MSEIILTGHKPLPHPPPQSVKLFFFTNHIDWNENNIDELESLKIKKQKSYKWTAIVNFLYYSFCKISNSLKIWTPKIIVKNNFSNASKMLNSRVFMKLWFLRFSITIPKEKLFKVCSSLSACCGVLLQKGTHTLVLSVAVTLWKRLPGPARCRASAEPAQDILSTLALPRSMLSCTWCMLISLHLSPLTGWSSSGAAISSSTGSIHTRAFRPKQWWNPHPLHSSFNLHFSHHKSLHGVLTSKHWLKGNNVLQNSLANSLRTYEERVWTGPLFKFDHNTEQNYIKI